MSTDEIEQRLGGRAGGDSAPTAFRRGLRSDFVAGFGDEAGDVDVEEPWAPRLLRPLGIGLGVAAALVLVLLIPFFSTDGDEVPAWRVVSLEGADEVLVDGRGLRPSAPELIVASEVESPAGKLLLERGGVLFIEVQPGTRWRPLRLEPRAGENLLLAVDEGEVYVRTAQPYSGPPLEIETPEGSVLVTGTALGVLVYPGGTCVCVCDGEVEVEPYGGRPTSRVAAGITHRVGRDGSDPVSVPFPPDASSPEHHAHVTALRAFAAR